MGAPPTALSMGELDVTYSTVTQSFYQYGGAYSFGGSAESLNPPAFYTCWEGVFFSK